MNRIRRHIVPLLRMVLALLLLFSATDSLGGSCPLMKRMEREAAAERSCCAKGSRKQDAPTPAHGCCSHQGSLCTCYPPLLLMRSDSPVQVLAVRGAMPAALPDEAIRTFSHEPPIPPPKV